MEKMKKILMGGMAMALAMPMFVAPMMAADGTGETPVSYSNSNEIEDPDNPASPEWVVSIPSAIKFTDTAKLVDTKVELKSPTEGGTLDAGLNVKVTVKSTNGFTLNEVGGAEELDYELYNEGTLLSDGTTNALEVGTLSAAAASKNGVAKLVGTATKAATYTDTLTYTATKQ